MPEKFETCVRIAGKTVHIYVNDKEEWKKFTQLIYEQHGHGAIAKVLYQLAMQYKSKYDGNSKKLDNFFDQSFIPKPDVDADFDTKILPWLRTRTNDELNKLRVNSYRSYVFSQGLLDIPPDKRQTTDLDYETLWRRYRW